MPSEPNPLQNIYRFIVRSRQENDPRSARYLADAHILGLTAVTALQCQDLYFIEGQLSNSDLERLARELLADPVAQLAEWETVSAAAMPPSTANGVEAALSPDHYFINGIIEVAPRPGVTDPVAEQLVRGAHELGISGVVRAATGLRFMIEIGGTGMQATPESSSLLHLLARRLLANAVIQRYALGEIEPVFPHPAEASGQVEILPVRQLDDVGLLSLSHARRAALDLAEMQAIQNYYRNEGRDPTDIEFETLAQTWSEHCGHKTFKARIEIRDLRVEKRDNSLHPTLDAPRNALRPLASTLHAPRSHLDSLFNTYIRSATEQIAAPWVRSAFIDNAGVIDFDDTYEISFKVETHNHPSAIEPFGGANTGVGGVIRDVLGVSAKPIANTDVLCFGPQDLPVDALPEGVLHPRRIQSGVVAGVQDYGNKIGIPTVNGAILYDPGYTANPLVFCGCVGIAPKGSHPRDPQPGDRVIMLGGRTGRDGLRGATFSSMTMDAQTGEVSSASVQIGDPITEKGLIEVVLRARGQGGSKHPLYHAVTDCGAGGLSSAVGEMASAVGAEVELQGVQLKYPGLAPWEIWLSEAQERMVLAVSPAAVPQLQAICATFEVNLTDIGEFTGTGRLVVRYAGQVVLDLNNAFLHEGIPQRQLRAVIRDQSSVVSNQSPVISGASSLVADHCSLITDYTNALLRLLSLPNIASKANVIRIYDHEVQGGTVVKPLTGAENDGPSDACVIKPIGTQGVRGIVLSNGINPEYGKLDAYRMAGSVIDEAIRNAVAVGADPERLALLDNFCWGDPLRPETLGSLVEACRGCYDAALHYRTPFISGKDSLNNEYLGSDGQRHAIPPTLLISAIGLIEDIHQAVTMDLKEPGNWIYLVGEFEPAISEQLSENSEQSRTVPGLPPHAPQIYRALHTAMQRGLVRACHDLSEGGLSVAAAEMGIGGRLGMALDLAPLPHPRLSDGGGWEGVRLTLFGETNGCLLVEVRPGDCPAFEACFGLLTTGGLPPVVRLGQVTANPILGFTSHGETLVSVPVPALIAAWNRQTNQ